MAKIVADQLDVVFAPYVDTSFGIILPDCYIRAASDAFHSYGGLFVLDCTASSCVWVNMRMTGVDFLTSAPQKGWSASPSAGLVIMLKVDLDTIKYN